MPAHTSGLSGLHGGLLRIASAPRALSPHLLQALLGLEHLLRQLLVLELVLPLHLVNLQASNKQRAVIPSL